MRLRHACTILALSSGVGACASLIGVQDLGVDPAPVKSRPDAQAPPDDGATVPAGDADVDAAIAVPPPLDAGCIEKATGANPPTLVTLTGQGDGWSNVTNVQVQDDSPAGCWGISSTDSQIIYAHGFDFAVPAGATIHGVKVTIRARGNAASDALLQLTPTGISQGQNLASATYTGAFTDRVYGSETNVWGLPLTPQLVNAPSFGVAFGIKKPQIVGTSAEVDAIKMTILYCD